MGNKDRVDLVVKTTAWVLQADSTVKAVGGSGVDIILRGMSDELLYTMVANNIQITTTKAKD